MADAGNRPVIVGAGLAGLLTALCLAPRPVILLTRAALGAEAASAWAQGGLAAAIGVDDAPELHATDTLAVGDGLCDPAAVRRITAAGPAVIQRLEALGVRFDRDAAGALRLGLEAAHGRRRIAHAEGDGTGREIMRALVDAVRRTGSIEIWEGVEARRLLRDDRGVAGVLVADRDGAARVVATRQVVIAAGGVGGLYDATTNPAASVGAGLAMAARAGAALGEMEFVQFHPTALDTGRRPMPLVSEAVRGEGAILVNEAGHRFMADRPGAELAPRDVVTRAIWRERAAGRRVFLDARAIPDFAGHFPQIARLCRADGIDPQTAPIPVRPAAHYHMGGIVVDAVGRSTVPGLWAVGEASCTGLHGANRLASNSLLEAAACAVWAAEDLAGIEAGPAPRPGPVPATVAAEAGAARAVVSRDVGVLRDAASLSRAMAALRPLATANDAAADPALVGLMIATAALRRTESRGAHSRTDHPGHAPGPARRTTLTLADALRIGNAPADTTLARSA